MPENSNWELMSESNCLISPVESSVDKSRCCPPCSFIIKINSFTHSSPMQQYESLWAILLEAELCLPVYILVPCISEACYVHTCVFSSTMLFYTFSMFRIVLLYFSVILIPYYPTSNAYSKLSLCSYVLTSNTVADTGQLYNRLRMAYISMNLTYVEEDKNIVSTHQSAFFYSLSNI